MKIKFCRNLGLGTVDACLPDHLMIWAGLNVFKCILDVLEAVFRAAYSSSDHPRLLSHSQTPCNHMPASETVSGFVHIDSYFLLHQAWLDHHARSLGLFVDGKFVRPADRQSCSLADSKGKSGLHGQLVQLIVSSFGRSQNFLTAS